MRFFETKDKTGRNIYLTDERWRHIAEEHPEVAQHLQEFRDVLSNPTKITAYEYDNNVKCYYKHFKQPTHYLLIIVKYLNGDGFIITAYFVRHIQ